MFKLASVNKGLILSKLTGSLTRVDGRNISRSDNLNETEKKVASNNSYVKRKSILDTVDKNEIKKTKNIVKNYPIKKKLPPEKISNQTPNADAEIDNQAINADKDNLSNEKDSFKNKKNLKININLRAYLNETRELALFSPLIPVNKSAVSNNVVKNELKIGSKSNFTKPFEIIQNEGQNFERPLGSLQKMPISNEFVKTDHSLNKMNTSSAIDKKFYSTNSNLNIDVDEKTLRNNIKRDKILETTSKKTTTTAKKKKLNYKSKNDHNDIPKEDNKSLEFDKKGLVKIKINNEEIIVNEEIVVSEKISPVIGKFSKQELDIIIDKIKTEDQAKVEVYISKKKSYFENLSLNKELFKNLTRFPLVNTETIKSNSKSYDESELKLSTQYLFNTNIKSQNTCCLPSVTKILEIVQEPYRRRYLLEYKINRIKQIGYEGFIRESQDKLDKGSSFHKFIEDKLSQNKEVKYPIGIDEDKIKALETFLQTDIKNVLLIEKQITHNNLFYYGRIDCLAYYKDTLCLIDWKTSEKSKQGFRDLFDIPVQMAAYIGAFLNDPAFEDLKKNHSLKNGLIINFNKLNGNIDTHVMNYQLTECYWYKWLNYLKRYWIIVNENKLPVE